jgi:UDP-N-acetyl-D-galactosamine dehydrogenase
MGARKISITGLGYVGLTIATAFGQIQKVIGYDTNASRIDELKAGNDKNEEISADVLKTSTIDYTTDPTALKEADFHIVAVLTPTKDNQPDLSILLKASETLGKQLKKGDIVVYESTVYPGATEEKCIPILESASQLICGKDFTVGYSPERINPADKKHTFSNITKVISATDKSTLNIIAEVYSSVVNAGVHPVSSIRIAEAVKVVENTQRDINISLVNEIALILHSLGMDSFEVFEAARTKWNFLPFQPGLVGGHCIGVNSYYLAHKAEAVGYHPDVILAGRRVNNYMTRYLAQETIKQLNKIGKPNKKSRIAVLGLTYKENCADLHDTKVIDLIRELQSLDADVLVHDPLADTKEAQKLYGIDLIAWEDLVNVDAIIIAVAHKQYSALSKTDFQKIFYRHGLIMDVKGILHPKDYDDSGIRIWRL